MVLTDIIEYTHGLNWHYRDHPLVLTGITGYTHWSLLTVQGTPIGPYQHYRVHPLVLTDITGYAFWSLLTLQGTPIGPYWQYRVCLLVLTDTLGSSLMLQNWSVRKRQSSSQSILSVQGTLMDPHLHYMVYSWVLNSFEFPLFFAGMK